MPSVAYRDRRRERARGVRLRKSVFLQVPAPVAAPIIGFATLLTATFDYLEPHEVWLGPVYLVLAASAAWFVSSGYAVALGLAVLSMNQLIGQHSIYPYGHDQFSANIGLRAFCVLAVAFMLGRARLSLEREWRLARTDPLTGALNRQAFFETMKAEAATDEPSVLVFADVDGLKYINDEMGHEAGDDGLSSFADRVRNAIRKDDLFARIGGDEFVVFMKVKDERAARKVADRLNKVLNVEVSEELTTLKCSLGALFLPAGSKSIDAELKLADKLMYSAKRVQAGVLMASAVQTGKDKALVSALETALPVNRKSVIRQIDASTAPQTAGDLNPGAGALVEFPLLHVARSSQGG